MYIAAADLFGIDQILHKHGAKFANALVREQHILQVNGSLIYSIYIFYGHVCI